MLSFLVLVELIETDTFCLSEFQLFFPKITLNSAFSAYMSPLILPHKGLIVIFDDFDQFLA